MMEILDTQRELLTIKKAMERVHQQQQQGQTTHTGSFPLNPPAASPPPPPPPLPPPNLSTHLLCAAAAAKGSAHDGLCRDAEEGVVDAERRAGGGDEGDGCFFHPPLRLCLPPSPSSPSPHRLLYFDAPTRGEQLRLLFHITWVVLCLGLLVFST